MPACFESSAYGLRIRSNLEIPGLATTAAAPSADPPLDIELTPGRTLLSREEEQASELAWRSDDPDGGPAVSLRRLGGGAGYHLRYRDGTEFLIDPGARRIHATWFGDATLEDTATYVMGPVLSLALRLRGATPVHAGAVDLGGVAVFFVGPSGAGKSTTTAAFAVNGWPVLTDDVTVLRPAGAHFLVSPGYPRVRLWSDSARALVKHPAELPLLTPNWDKRYLPLGGRSFGAAPLPLGGIFLLTDREDHDRAPHLRRLEPMEAFRALLPNTLAAAADPGFAVADFRLVARLAGSVPAFALTPHADPARLADLCRLVAAQGLASGREAPGV